MGLFLGNDIETLYLGNEEVEEVYLGSELIWTAGLPIGQTFNFEYTGTVQEVTLPPGRYKLQCWGAQGGTSSGSSSGVGSRGGYSEGVLTLNETKTLYVFVGGKGASSGKGGWNGGGYSSGSSDWTSSGTYGRSRPACGGGATDIALVSSTMSYDSYRTNRSSESLLSRFIVAGGGAGGSYRYTETETTSTTNQTLFSNVTFYLPYHSYQSSSSKHIYGGVNTSTNITVAIGDKLWGSYSLYNTDKPYYWCGWYETSQGDSIGSAITTISKEYLNNIVRFGFFVGTTEKVDADSGYALVSGGKTISETSTSTSSSYSGNSKQGGGTSGRGQYPGTQSSAGSGGGFGYGANMTTTNYRYCSGAGGGGWYGGGSAYSDSSTSYIGYTGGGSGFVNIASNSSYRPSGYTGLQLDSGTTYQGNSSFPNTAGTGNETGHQGNGYAKITVIE